MHTAVSNDARSPLSDVLDHAFNDFDLDYLGLSNHMRNNSQTNDDANIGRPMLFGEALTEHELPGVAELVAANESYQDRLIYSSFEWDMPAHEHYNVGILWDDDSHEIPVDKIKEFESGLLDHLQANFLKEIFNSKKLTIDKIIDIEIDQNTIINRIKSRQKIEKREDDNLSVIKTRITKYLAETKPLSDFYKSEFPKDFHIIRGDQEIEKIHQDILKITKNTEL